MLKTKGKKCISEEREEQTSCRQTLKFKLLFKLCFGAEDTKAAFAHSLADVKVHLHFRRANFHIDSRLDAEMRNKNIFILSKLYE